MIIGAGWRWNPVAVIASTVVVTHRARAWRTSVARRIAVPVRKCGAVQWPFAVRIWSHPDGTACWCRWECLLLAPGSPAVELVRVCEAWQIFRVCRQGSGFKVWVV